MEYMELTEKSLGGTVLDRNECLSVLRCPDERLLELLQAAFSVRYKYFGKKVVLHMLLNAKSGMCSEDCSYCSQSAASNAPIEKYPLLEEERIVKGAGEASAAKAKRFCIVTSGAAPSGPELDRLCRAISRIKSEVGIEICASLGFLTAEAAEKLRQAGADRYNHNINTSEKYYSRICSTHGYGDRLEALKNARKAGLDLCCGVLFGMGESEDDIIDATLALREVKPDSIPVNFLHPIPGTALEKQDVLSPVKCLAMLCLVRFLNPSTEIRAAGGREYRLRSLQPLALYPANSIFVSGYLTTSGQSAEDAWRMIEDMGFVVEREAVEEVGASL